MTLIAGIDAENERSIALHENYGFVHAGTIKKAGYKFNKWLDLAFINWSLMALKSFRRIEIFRKHVSFR